MIQPAEILAAKVLIVDDQAANILLLERTLAGAGYTHVTSTNDPRAVAALHKDHRYDLILLDLQMPVMDGFEVIEALKPLEQEGYLPVLVVTAQPGHKLRALRAGAKDFVSKPFDLTEVLLRVHNMLEVRLYGKALAQAVRDLEASRIEVKRLFGECLAERKVSERLALLLPLDSIARRLPARAEAGAESLGEVTVLIADVVGFSTQVPVVEHTKLLLFLEEIFSRFDELGAERGLRKVKTLGNSYMAAAGVPSRVANHAEIGAALALDLIDEVDRFNERRGTTLRVRIGLGSGPALADLLGRQQYVYDLWGDAVEEASRMEAGGVPGRARVSPRTKVLLGKTFACEERASLDDGSGGEEKTWLLAERRPA